MEVVTQGVLQYLKRGHSRETLVEEVERGNFIDQNIVLLYEKTLFFAVKPIKLIPIRMNPAYLPRPGCIEKLFAT